jgi:hypothetical protein
VRWNVACYHATGSDNSAFSYAQRSTCATCNHGMRAYKRGIFDNDPARTASMRDEDCPDANLHLVPDFNAFGVLVIDENIIPDEDIVTDGHTAGAVQRGPHRSGAGAKACEDVKKSVKDPSMK